MNIALIFSIVLTLFSLIYTILQYYGVIRYIKLKRQCTEKYSDSYLKLPRADSKGKVVVSMYIDSDSIDNNITIKSILDQTVHPDHIIIVSKHDITLPDSLKKNNLVVLQKTNENLGRAAAFMIPLQTQKDEDTKIIVVTDGVVYGTDFIESLIEESEKLPDNMVFVEMYDPSAYIERSKFVRARPNYQIRGVIRVSSGVLIKPKFFKKFVNTISPHMFKAPDALLTVNALYNNIEMSKADFNEIIRVVPEAVNESEKITMQIYGYIFKL